MEAETDTGALPDEEAEAPGFEINGERYEIPTLDTINLDEERILYVYADVVLQDFAPVHPGATEQEKMLYNAAQLRYVRNPDFKRALAHIAYRRQHPEVSDADIQSAIGLVNALEVDIAMLRGEVEDEDPTKDSQTSSESGSVEKDSFSQTSELSEPMKTGSDTESESGHLVVIPSPTGTSESDTSSASSPAIVA